ncbi:MAG: glycosyltransferase family 2 protein [Gemmataceae bacterium]
MSAPKILIITPAKNEAEFIGETIASMTAQTVRPTRWIIVDDGSTDGTAEIVEKAGLEHPWIGLVRREGTKVRRVGPGVIEAFYEGLSHARLEDYDFVCKLDADLRFRPEYFAILMKRFEENPRLGTASGKSWNLVGDKLVEERTHDQMSNGQAKLYRRECFQEIGGFVHEVMWDGIDCHRCRMLGWESASFRDPELVLTHLRQMGSSFRSIYHGRMRWGYGQYFMGTHPLYALGISVYRMFERPWVLGGLCILAGYCKAWLERRPRYNDLAFRKFLRRWQMQELARRFFGGRSQQVPTA